MRLEGIRRIGLLATVVLALSGCENGLSNAWWNAFLDPTAVGNFRHDTVMDIQRSISFRDTPVGIVGAEDPKPSDLVADVSEYEIGPGDSLQIVLLDFVQLGAETNLAPTVDELGYIDLPQLGSMRTTGRTARELKSDIIQKAKAAGIYQPEDDRITVTVTVTNPLQRMYNVSGQLLYPGPYRISRPDFRLREAINLGGGMDDTVKNVWVYRNAPAAVATTSAPAPASNERTPSIPVPPPPVSPVLMADLQASVGSPSSPAASKPEPGARQAATNTLALPSDEVPKDLIEAVSPPKNGGATPAATPPAAAPPAGNTPAKAQGTPSGLPSYKFVNDAFIEVPAERSTAMEGEAQQKAPAAPSATTTRPGEAPVDWEALASEAQYRIIRIPADKLRNGDPNYNIVIKHNDWIRVDPGPVGLYYFDGYVMRPGPYSLAGEQITLTQAIAAAGGLNQLAWPTRCEIRRRLDGDREEITQWDLARILDGKDPDLYLKPNDVIRVGTHAIAPLLATIRNSFRFTYGFGFVYDRNFADVDSFSSQVNPKDRHRTARETRFSNLFQ
jgi:polysaccharide export outer membrane protein